MYKKILVGIDDSEDSYRAAKRVSELAKSNTKVILFHAVDLSLAEKIPPVAVTVPGTGAPVVPPTTTTEVKAAKIAKGKQLLENAKEGYFKETLAPVELRVIEDEGPKDYLDHIVDEEDIDLVALGCKGEHSKLKRVLLGTIATHALNKLDSDVLIVR